MKRYVEPTPAEERLILSRKAISMAIAFLSGRMVQESQEEVLEALKRVLEMMPADAALKWSAMEMVYLAAQDYIHPCSCCRSKGCHNNCRCSNSDRLKEYIARSEDMITRNQGYSPDGEAPSR